MRANWNYLNSLVSFFIGILSGFKAIYVRYPTAPMTATRTLPGVIYLLTRGAFPAGIFAWLYYSRTIESHLFLYALALGVAAETVLRSQILIKQSRGSSGGIDELVKGPLDLLRWYQDILLGGIGAKNAGERQDFLKVYLPQENFKTLCQRVRDNANAFDDPIRGLEEAIAKLIKEFDEDATDTATKNDRYRLKLGYTVLRLVGQQGFQTLFKKP